MLLSICSVRVVCSLIVVSVCALPFQAAAQEEKLDLNRVKMDFQRLVPYLSMDGDITLELLDATKVAKKLGRVHEYVKLDFGSHPLLAKVGRSHMEYLIQSESRIIPVFRAQDFELESIFGELFSRAIENQVLRNWQLESDAKCEAGYSTVMPVARLLAAKPDQNAAAKIVANYGDGSLSVSHEFDKDLSNATLSVQLETIVGPTCPAYFFVPEWRARSPYQLRLPARWRGIGADATVKMTLEVLSDQRSTEQFIIELPKNRVPAAERALRDVATLAKGAPADVIAGTRFLSTLEDKIPDTDDMRQSVKGLRKELGDAASNWIPPLQQQIKSTQQQLAARAQWLKNKRVAPQQRPAIQSQIESLRERLKTINATILELRKVR
jgi:hypothetical protein